MKQTKKATKKEVRINEILSDYCILNSGVIIKSDSLKEGMLNNSNETRKNLKEIIDRILEITFTLPKKSK